MGGAYVLFLGSKVEVRELLLLAIAIVRRKEFWQRGGKLVGESITFSTAKF